MLRSIMAQIMSLEPPEEHAIGPDKAGTSNLTLVRPACGTVGGRRFASRARQTDIATATMIAMIPPDAAMYAPSTKTSGA